MSIFASYMLLFQKEIVNMNIFEKASCCTKIWISIAISIVYAVLLALYQQCVQGLEKPAGVYEALTFLFKYPKEYCGALILGLLIHAICIATIGIVILCITGVLKSQLRPNIVMLINLVIAVVMVVLNNIYAKYVMALVIALIAVIAIIWVIASSDT